MTRNGRYTISNVSRANSSNQLDWAEPFYSLTNIVSLSNVDFKIHRKINTETLSLLGIAIKMYIINTERQSAALDFDHNCNIVWFVCLIWKTHEIFRNVIHAYQPRKREIDTLVKINIIPQIALFVYIYNVHEFRWFYVETLVSLSQLRNTCVGHFHGGHLPLHNLFCKLDAKVSLWFHLVCDVSNSMLSSIKFSSR